MKKSILCLVQLSFESVSSFAKYVADSMFTYFVINTLSMITWRSTLGLYWVILAFDNPVIADVVSSAIGIGGCTLLFAMETCIAKVSHCRTSQINKSRWDDLVMSGSLP
jgi:Fuseless